MNLLESIADWHVSLDPRSNAGLQGPDSFCHTCTLISAIVGSILKRTVFTVLRKLLSEVPSLSLMEKLRASALVCSENSRGYMFFSISPHLFLYCDLVF